MEQNRLSHPALFGAERAFVNRVDIEKVIDEFSQKKLIPSSFSNRFLQQKILVMYFKSCKESELVSSMLFKRNLSLPY